MKTIMIAILALGLVSCAKRDGSAQKLVTLENGCEVYQVYARYDNVYTTTCPAGGAKTSWDTPSKYGPRKHEVTTSVVQ